MRTPTAGGDDVWDALPGDTRWVDYSHAVEPDGALVVYVHTFRRYRDRSGTDHDLLGWKPGTTKVAQVYEPDEWDDVQDAVRAWPPPGLEAVERVDRPPRERRRAR